MPSPHSTQVSTVVAAEVDEKVPAGHGTQVESDDAPVESEYVPGLQDIQTS